MVKSYRIGQSNAAKSPNIKGETFNDYNQEEMYMTNKYEIKPIPNHTDYYCDTNGIVYSSINKGCRDRFNENKRTELHEMKYRYTKQGYARVYLRCDDTGKRKDFYVHRIVAELFCKNDDPENKKQVDHKNNYRFDNSAENLWWVTPKDNWNYASTEGFRGRDEKGRFCHI